MATRLIPLIPTRLCVFPAGDSMVQSMSNTSMPRNYSSNEINAGGELASHKSNIHFMRKIPPGAEASNILVGEVEFLEKTLSAFVRLNQAHIMGDLTEVPVPTRYVYSVYLWKRIMNYVQQKHNSF